MKRHLPLLFLGVTSLALAGIANGCGSSDDGAGPGGDDGDASVDTGGPGGDGTTPGDTAGAPTFAGAKTATATGEKTITLTWDPASDDTTPPAKIAYRIYLSPTGTPTDFSAPVVTAASGSTTTIVDGLNPGTKYYFIVRAVDESGLTDDNTHVVSATTFDNGAPTFAGITKLTASATELRAEWDAASDLGTPSAGMVYRVYLSAAPGAEDFSTPKVTTAPGATFATIPTTGLTEGHDYFAVVRAVDGSGNSDTNTIEKSTTTLDKTAPTFGGATSATALGTIVTVGWTAASDNVDGPEYIKYDVYQSTTSGTFDFTKPTFTTAPGATSYTALGLTTSTTYYFVVRARDSSGNAETNTVEKSATTASKADVTAPTFAGLTSISSSDATSLDLAWSPASDDFSAPARIVYDVFFATTAGGETFAGPSFTTAAGATSFHVTGLKPSTPYYAVVRARDEAGNEETNVVEKSGTTAADVTAPTFGGATSATAVSETVIQVGWAAATDDASASGDIKYQIYTVPGPTGGALTLVGTTLPGVLNFNVGGLSPNTAYYFVVRAVDEAGNADTNLVVQTGTTNKDVTAPTFAGIVDAVALGPASAQLSWKIAVDNVSPASKISYDAYVATTSGGEDFTKSAGKVTDANSLVLTGLSPGVTYYFVVRATDEFGNQDTNKVEFKLGLPADKTAPTFAGATGIVGTADNSLTVGFDPATDDVTAPSSIQYQVCWSLTFNACVTGFSAMATVPGSTACATLPCTYKINALTPAKTYYVVVRAKDAAGNVDTNTAQVSGVTQTDVTPPTFAGLVSAVAAGPATVNLTWNPGSDNISTAAQLAYDVYRVSASGTEVYTSPQYTFTNKTLTPTVQPITGLTPSTTYYFVVLARDMAGNRSTVKVEKVVTTPADVTAPTFGGATSVTTISDTQLRVNWVAATDDSTPSSGIVYRVCWRTDSSCSTSFTTMATTAAGATSYTAGGLLPNTATTGDYFFVVRAVDAYGHADTNTVVRSGTTSVDTTPPTFVGSVTVSPVYANTVASSGTLNANWADATDNAWPASQIAYQVCRSTVLTDCTTNFASHIYTTTAKGVSSYSFTGLNDRTRYYVGVRAIDASGAVEASAHSGNNTTATSFSKTINVDFYTGTCSGCHAWTYANTVSVASSCGASWPRIDPGSPSTSLVYRLLGGATACIPDRMPKGGSAVSSTMLNEMNDWITQGAHNN